MKKTIGFKSTGKIALNIIVFLLLFIMLIALLWMIIKHELELSELIWVIIIGSGFLIYLIISIIIEVSRPNDAIECDDENLYLNYKNKTLKLPLGSIIQVMPRRAHARYATYTFGKIIIHTSTEEHIINNISNCEYVSLDIMRIKNRFLEKIKINKE